MVFSSGVFLFIFLPVVLVLHTVIKNIQAKNALLIIASVIFYAYGEPLYVLLLIASVGINFLIGNQLIKHKSKGLLALAVIINLSLLVVFKYTGFLVELVNYIPGVSIPVPRITMPIGISFFTFQSVSYVIDTYKSDKQELISFFNVLLYISLFPQLIAGPIVKFNTIKDELSKRTITPDKMAAGIRRFVVGLSKKMLIANTTGSIADKVFAMNIADVDMPLSWVAAICYTLQIYFDFSGYSDMALGLGKMLGFDFPENFDHPYTAISIREFWRKWHMSLTSWFREYLYIPLGGNRKGKIRQMLNSMIVFLCTGIWHGANLTFLFWGFYHGVLISAETALSKKKNSRTLTPLRWLYTIFFVIIGFAIFRSDNITNAFRFIGKMFSFSITDSAGRTLISLMTPTTIILLIVSVIASTPVICWFKNKNVFNILGYVLTFALYFLCIMTLAADSYNPFIYFRF